MQPGGKPEIGETPEAALIRELEEELNFSVSPEELVPVGRFTDTAANEPGHTVSADIFQIATNRANFTPTAEIEEVIWYTPGQDRHIKLAPLTENHLLPLLKEAQAPGRIENIGSFVCKSKSTLPSSRWRYGGFQTKPVQAEAPHFTEKHCPLLPVKI